MMVCVVPLVGTLLLAVLLLSAPGASWAGVAAVVVFLLSAVLGLGLAFKAGSSLQSGARSLAEVASALAQGDLTRKCPQGVGGELGEAGQHLNQAIDRLQQDIKLIHQMVEQAASTATELSAGMSQMDGATQEISTGADRQRVEVEAATQSVDGISTFLGNVLVGIGKDVEMLDRMVQVGEGSVHNVHDSIRAMGAIRESSAKVEAITTVIAEIANQTNLLSLNAAIEAAKALEYGKGFAVVAEEVRKLAERSAGAAQEISLLIQESGERVHKGAESVQVVQGGLEDLVTFTRRIADGARASLVGVRSQGEESGNLAGRMKNTLDIVESNASATHQLSAAVSESVRTIEQLALMAHDLSEVSRRFTLPR
nr:methyl-accepting chemotaxis protein [uncultured Holophaga sp.]